MLFVAAFVSFDQSTYIVNENGGSVQLLVILSNELSNTVTVTIEVLSPTEQSTGEYIHAYKIQYPYNKT